MSSDSAECDRAGKSCPRAPSENAKSEFEIIGTAGPTRRTGSLLLLMKVSPVHRDSVANICLRIQRERAARGRAIRIDGRKVVPTKGEEEIRSRFVVGQHGELLLLMKVQPIYVYIAHPRRNSHDRSPLIKFDRFATESVSFVVASGLTSHRKISRS